MIGTPKHRASDRGRRGLSTVELMIGTTILTLLGISIANSTGAMRGLAFSSAAQDALQIEARQAMQTIADDLRRAGELTLDQDGTPVAYPHLFEGGAPDEEYAAPEHGHDVAPKGSAAGDYEFGLDQEILMVLPADADNDGAPDFNLLTGELVWAPDQRVSYTRQLGTDGSLNLVRTVDGGQSRVIARDVELLRFDMTTPLTPEVPIGSVRVQLAFRSVGEDGNVHRYRIEYLVRMRSHDAD